MIKRRNVWIKAGQAFATLVCLLRRKSEAGYVHSIRPGPRGRCLVGVRKIDALQSLQCVLAESRETRSRAGDTYAHSPLHGRRCCGSHNTALLVRDKKLKQSIMFGTSRALRKSRDIHHERKVPSLQTKLKELSQSNNAREDTRPDSQAAYIASYGTAYQLL